MDFIAAQEFFRNDNFRELTSVEDGRRFLKLRSLSRKSHMEYLVKKHSIDVGALKSSEWLEAIYRSEISNSEIDDAIFSIYEQERSKRRESEKSLISELYRITSFGWGGLHQSSLERTIVDRYVKKTTSFDALCASIEGELHNRMRAYALASWYNHWTSIIIEDIFNDHEKVVPAIGQIKKIDFFIDDQPFDLKVTYFPEGYIKDQRKWDGLKSELALMKKLCRDLDIEFDDALAESALIPNIWRKLEDHPSPRAKELICELQAYRKALLNDSVVDSDVLIRWLYENQGTRRFDASNRLFLILVDTKNFFDSWKLKRAKPLIQREVRKYLDRTERFGSELEFSWQGIKFGAEADVVFVLK